MRASHQARPKTLLAVVGAFSTGAVILPPAILAQEERRTDNAGEAFHP